MKNLKKSTRKSMIGLSIACPHCGVYEIAHTDDWKAKQCPCCHKTILKEQYLVDEELDAITKKAMKRIPSYLRTKVIEKLINKAPNEIIIEQLRNSFKAKTDIELMTTFAVLITDIQIAKIRNVDKFKINLMLLIKEGYERLESKNDYEMRNQKQLNNGNDSSSNIKNEGN